MSYALVTGATKRIGRCITLFLAQSGWDIILHYNTSKAEAFKLQKEIIIDLGRKCELYQEDFLQSKESNIADKFPISLLINNASIFKNDTLYDIKEEDLFDNLKINFFNPVRLSNKILQNKPQNQQINIINILDNTIFKLPINFASYYFSKIALADFTKLAAKLYAPMARVNGIALGPIIKTPTQTKENFNKIKKATPLGYGGNIEEICFTVDFIVKAKSLTGQIISLDGGSHLDNINYP